MIGLLYEHLFKWATEIQSNGFRGIKDDAPDNIKQEAKEADSEHFKRTGRHLFNIDY